MVDLLKYLRLFLVFAAIHLTQSDQCVVRPPCFCSGSAIDCSNKHMTSVPRLTGHANTTYRMRLDGNSGLVISDGLFSNISLEYLNLDNNVRLTISDHAFRSQRNSLREVHLANCHLTEVPRALRDLDALEKLYIWSNDIRHWDDSLMMKLSGTLNVLDVSSTGLTSWPGWLSHMSNLVYLNVYHNHIDVIPHDAFYSSASTMNHLDMERCGISDMTTAVRSLNNLTNLIVGGETMDDFSFFYNWLPAHDSKLTTLSINNCNITRIPFGINKGSSLKILSIINSKVRHVDEESMPKGLMALSIVEAFLTHVHGGICNPELSYLRLSFNRIRTIEKHDLEDCQSLTYLNLNDNLIDYISPSAFDGMAKLRTLRLEGNKMTHIPPSMTSLTALTSFFIDGNPLECTCQTLWFVQWHERHPAVYVSGRCTLLGIKLADFRSHCAGTIIG